MYEVMACFSVDRVRRLGHASGDRLILGRKAKNFLSLLRLHCSDASPQESALGAGAACRRLPSKSRHLVR